MITQEEIAAGMARERELWDKSNDAKLDIRLAERAGDEAGIEAAKRTADAAISEWHKQYVAVESALKLWLTSHGLNPKLVRHILA